MHESHSGAARWWASGPLSLVANSSSSGAIALAGIGIALAACAVSRRM